MSHPQSRSNTHARPQARRPIPEPAIKPVIRRSFMVNGFPRYALTPAARAEQLARIQVIRERVIANATKTLSEKEQVAELARCMQDFCYFCDTYLITFDPRQPTAGQRFILYDFQRDAAARIIAAIRDGKPLLIEKSRDMGASWLIMAVILWFWLFEAEFHALVGSRVEDLVDDFTIDSLFGKIDYMLEKLPDWMKGQAPYNPKTGRRKLKIASDEGSLISGESANQSFGRGPRKRVVAFDEFAHTEFDDPIWTGIADTAPCKLVFSSVMGENNKFAQLRFSGQIDVLTFHWTDHPLKTEEWYDEYLQRHGPLVTAQEVDIDYKASGGKMAFPELKANRSSIITVPFDPDPKDFLFDMGLDWGTNNPSALLTIMRSRTMTKSERWPKQWCIWEHYAPAANMEELAVAITTCPFYPLVQHIWSDPSMWFNNQSSDDGKGLTNTAQLFYRYFGITLSSGKRGDGFPLQQLRAMWADPSAIGFFIFETCPSMIDEFERLHFKPQSSLMASRKNASEQLVDKDNHTWDALKYYFNRTFDATIIVPEKEILTGYDQLNEAMDEMRVKKLYDLAHPKKNKSSRRLFRY